MTSSSPVSVIIPAAGIGSRMHHDTPKQYLSIAGKTIIEHSIDAFIDHPTIKRIVVCLHKDDTTFSNLSLSQHPKINVVEGGASRAASVHNGLAFLVNKQTDEWVMVHDAARPLLSQHALNMLLKTRENNSMTCGAILAIPAVDTVKLANTSTANNMIEKTLDRNRLWLAQTPQLFKTKSLLHALNMAIENNQEITDEASAMEYIGEKVDLIHGEKANFKITHIEDLALAEFYLSQNNTTQTPK